MPEQKKESNISTDNVETIDETRVESRQQAEKRRRLADAINSKGRKLKLDRRIDQNDRRLDTASEYKGPSRRKTIDQRENMKDRRNKD
jgi:hypothetical protein